MSRRPPEGGGRTAALARSTATLCGVGRFPLVPGTAGSAVGLALYWALYQGGRFWPLAALPVVAAAAVWSAGVLERLTGRKDPPEVVVDELAGQFLCLLGAPPSALHLAAGFVVFRILDVVKPMRRLETIRGGWGVVADDLFAGAVGWFVLAGSRAAGLL